MIDINGAGGATAAGMREGRVMQRNYAIVSASVFALVAVIQIVRAASAWPVQIGPYAVPVAVSWVLAAVAIALAVWGYRSGGLQS